MKTLSTAGLSLEQAEEETEEVLFTETEEQIFNWFCEQLEERIPKSQFKKLMEMAKYRKAQKTQISFSSLDATRFPYQFPSTRFEEKEQFCIEKARKSLSFRFC
jgi:hypothetical protein